jgi:plastocyanin
MNLLLESCSDCYQIKAEISCRSISSTNSGLVDKNNRFNFVSLTENLTSDKNPASREIYNDKAFYILIKSVNNKTNFVPDKVTLTEGDKVLWLNHDNLVHRVTVGPDPNSGYQLLNSLILPNGMVE